MKHRFLTAAVALALLLIGYKVYQLLVVPMLEGPQAEVSPLVPEFVSAARSPAPDRDLLRDYFPPDSWERTSATVLRSADLILAVQHWEQLDEHRLKITPCTIVYAADHSAEESATATAPTSGRTWIVQATEGAVLYMDQPSDIRRGSLGKVSAIYIPGRVRLTGSESAPGAGDSLELITNHLQLNEQKIWTPNEVEVHWGNNTMQGSDLTLHLSQSKSSDQPLGLALGKTGLRSAELVHLNLLKVQLPSEAADQQATTSISGWLEVRCAGPLVVDLLAGVARITSQVQLARMGNPQQEDQLQCDEVVARFSQWTTDKNQFDSVQLERIVATGRPTVVRSRQWQADERSRQPGKSYEFSCPKWEYDFASGEFAAHGSGKFVVEEPAADEHDEEAKVNEPNIVTWQRELRWGKPADTQGDREMQLVVDGNARCTSRLGLIEADIVRIWVEPTADQAPRMGHRVASANGRPRRIIAEGKVQLRSEVLDGAAEKLDVVILPEDSGSVSELPEVPVAAMPLRAPTNSPRIGKAGANRYQVYGQVMRVSMQQSGKRWNVRDVTLDQHVRCMAFHQDGTDAPRAMELEGRTLLLRGLSEGEGIAHITGTPARIRAGKMSLEGPAIQLDRQQNRIWIDGVGSANVPLPAQLANRYPQDAAFAYVTWQHGLNFNGNTITCEQNVQVRGPAQLVSADRLSIRLSNPIDLSRQEFDKASIDLESVSAEGDVRIENRALGQGGLESVDLARVPRLTFQYKSGELIGDGPGYIETVRVQNAGARVPGGLDQGPLMYLRVEFQQQFSANLNKRQADFRNHVFAIYAPVSDWNQRITPSSSTPLTGGQLLMTCDQFSIFQIRARDPKDAPMELVAQGNATIEGEQFKAEAHRMSYDQGKDVFVLEGSGRGDVHLVRQTQPGGPRQETNAEKVRYSPSANTVQVNGMKMLNLGTQPSSLR